MKIVEAPSPSFNDRPEGSPVDSLILHYTGMVSGAAAMERLRDPEIEVSSHYVVEEDGAVFRLVEEERRAWHAGVSHWSGRDGLNDVSIGIEIVNPGHDWGLKPFPEPQIAAVAALSQDIIARWRIPQARVLAHSDIAPDRKRDPGDLFPWERLAAEGVGLWPTAPHRRSGQARPTVIEAQRLLARWGYPVAETGALDARTRAATAAFQRRFRPAIVDGVLDAECAALLEDLIKRGASSQLR